MDQNPNSFGSHERSGNLTSSSRYDEPPPSYSQSIQLPILAPPGVNPTSSISTVPAYSEDFLPPYSAPPPNTSYGSAPYPTQQPTTINGLPSNDTITSAPTRTPVYRINDYMGQSIVSLLLCCPLGLLALFFSLKTRWFIEVGDLESADISSRTALILNRISRCGFILTIFILVLLTIFVFTKTNKPKNPWDMRP